MFLCFMQKIRLVGGSCVRSLDWGTYLFERWSGGGGGTAGQQSYPIHLQLGTTYHTPHTTAVAVAVAVTICLATLIFVAQFLRQQFDVSKTLQVYMS